MLYYILIITITVLVTQGRPSTTYSPSTGLTSEHRCKRHLRHHIESCIEGFETILIIYRDTTTSNWTRRSMIAEFCHEYGETLQCLHTVLQQCQPEMEHLNLIAHRVGYLRDYMDSTCYVSPDQMTPAHSRRRTTTPPPPKEDSREPMAGVAYEHLGRDNTRSTLSNASDRKKYHYNHVDELGKSRASETPALMNDEDHKNSIPLNLDEQQNGVNIDTNVIHIKGPEDCNEINSKNNAMCAMFLHSSASSLSVSTGLLFTLLTWVLVQL